MITTPTVDADRAGMRLADARTQAGRLASGPESAAAKFADADFQAEAAYAAANVTEGRR